MVCVGGCHVRFVSSHLRCLRRPLRGLAPETLVVISSDPEPRGRRSAGRRTTLDFVAPVRRDATLARRSRPAQPGRRLSALHRGVCPKPAASPALPEPGQGWLAGPLFMGGCEPRARSIRGYEPRRTPHPRSACWIVSGRRPSRARMGISYYKFVMKSRKMRIVVEEELRPTTQKSGDMTPDGRGGS